MTKKDVQLNIRMTRDLKDRIEASAKANNRTANAEAITLIEFALAAQDHSMPNLVNEHQKLENIDENTSTPKESQNVKNAMKLNEELRTEIMGYLEDLTARLEKLGVDMDELTPLPDRKKAP
ncbi:MULTISPECIES: Arc family DNA-binding protein [Xenorhabdus]|uniref:Arc family DNA-binding protein n=1 Tax=Xenorhabdus TaxID=626 RepID=UPI00064A3E61|nr:MULTISPECIES: Arc family DNA-binding protein [Xenorhabdus]KLU14354.1 hypothetical protein AAY47_16920 [Xenorhabdus griffiniae]KOP33743.1 hypothetical protein AFK69_08220 [Xenorhabdus sp. GDc328]WFQ80515.1 Arc family DNA-binding protein [Xenorhabdus sp. SF857]